MKTLLTLLTLTALATAGNYNLGESHYDRAGNYKPGSTVYVPSNNIGMGNYR